MKRLMKKNICVSSWCQVVAVSIFILQFIQLVDAQSLQSNSIHPNDHLELIIDTNERQNRALKASEEENCPMCNFSEVSDSKAFLSKNITCIPASFCKICH